MDSANESILCQVYKNGPNEETYLFVNREQGLDALPDALKLRFQSPVLVTQFKLTTDKKLARANAATVMASIREKGFYLQLPPLKEELMSLESASIAAKNDKLSIK